MLRGDIASLLFAHGKVVYCKKKELIKGRLKRLCGREPCLWILDLKDSKFGLYFTVSLVDLMTEFSDHRYKRSSDGVVL
jgi:hypothetical protein